MIRGLKFMKEELERGKKLTVAQEMKRSSGNIERRNRGSQRERTLVLRSCYNSKQ